MKSRLSSWHSLLATLQQLNTVGNKLTELITSLNKYQILGLPSDNYIKPYDCIYFVNYFSLKGSTC